MYLWKAVFEQNFMLDYSFQFINVSKPKEKAYLFSLLEYPGFEKYQ